jgi:hypothetical protein
MALLTVERTHGRPDFSTMPYTHRLVAGILRAVAAAGLCKVLCGPRNWSAAAWIGAAVFSHWVLDWVVHRPDLSPGCGCDTCVETLDDEAELLTR